MIELDDIQPDGQHERPPPYVDPYLAPRIDERAAGRLLVSRQRGLGFSRARHFRRRGALNVAPL